MEGRKNKVREGNLVFHNVRARAVLILLKKMAAVKWRKSEENEGKEGESEPEMGEALGRWKRMRERKLEARARVAP